MAGDSNLGRDAEAVTGVFAYAADLLLRNNEQWREKIRLRYERFFRIRRSTSKRRFFPDRYSFNVNACCRLSLNRGLRRRGFGRKRRVADHKLSKGELWLG